MTTPRDSFFKFLSAPPAGSVAVLVGLAVGVIGNLIAGIIALAAGTSAWLLTLWSASIVVLLLVGWALYRARRPQQPLVLVAEEERPARCRGLIVLVSRLAPGDEVTDSAAWAAIQYHATGGPKQGLQYCWLIASEGETGSLPVALQLKERCEALRVKAITRGVANPFVVQETYDLVQKIYAEEVAPVGLVEGEVMADITGGTSPMSAGVALACGDRRPMQYMYGRKVASIPRLIRFAARPQATVWRPTRTAEGYREDA